MQIDHTLETEGHTYGGSQLAGKCSNESTTLLEGGEAWVYMEHKLGTRLRAIRVKIKSFIHPIIIAF